MNTSFKFKFQFMRQVQTETRVLIYLLTTGLPVYVTCNIMSVVEMHRRIIHNVF